MKRSDIFIKNRNIIMEPTRDDLVTQIKLLTEQQEQLFQTISALQMRADDPFVQFRTPDPIKNLPTFGGNKKETQAWLEDVENTLDLFASYRGQPIYQQLIRAVKSKIVGEAKEILIASGNPNMWEEIKNALLNSYGDRRDLTSHIQSLFYAKQGKKTLTEFYNKIKAIDTSIKATAASMEEYKDATKAINCLISLITVTRFVDGLGDTFSMHVRSYRPETLEDAYNITMQFSNAAFRKKLDETNAFRQPPKSFTKPYQNTDDNVGTSKHFGKNNYPASGNQKHSSARFKNFRNPHDDDVSMKTHNSKMQINTHESKELATKDDTEEAKEEPDTSQLDSEDDDFFCDEINFQLVNESKAKT